MGRQSADFILERAGEPVSERRFGRGIIGVTGLTEDSRSRTDQDHVPASLPSYEFEKLAAAEEHGREIGLDCLAPLPQGHGVEWDVALHPDAGIGDEGVDASEGSSGAVEKFPHFLFAGEVRRHGQRLGGRQVPLQLLHAAAAPVIMQDDSRSLRGKQTRGARANPPGGAGDEDDLSRQASVHRGAGSDPPEEDLGPLREGGPLSRAFRVIPRFYRVSPGLPRLMFA